MVAITASVGRGGVNRSADVKAVQALLNSRLHFLTPLAPLAVTGVADHALFFMIEEYQRRRMGLPSPDGRIDPGGRTLRHLNENGSAMAPAQGGEPLWLTIARKEVGTREIRGVNKNSEKVLEYIRTFPYLADIWNDAKKKDYKLADVDETPWCACFVNWCLLRAGKAKGPSARAKDWAQYGVKLDQPKPGAICVVYRTPKNVSSGVTTSGYHVAFWTGGSAGSLKLLGGNQTAADKTTEEVNEKTTSGYWTVQAYRWPA